MEVKTLPKLTEDEIEKYKKDSDLFGKDMRQIAASSNNQKNTPTKTYLYCRDLGADVLITRDSFKHGAARMDAAYIAVCKNIADVLNNSIAVNEFKPRDITDGGYVLLGMAETEDSYVIVRSIVNKKTWKLEEYEELDAIKKKSIKKEDVGFKPPHYIHTNGYGTSSIISIADFLNFVNTQNIANSVLPLDVINKLGTTRGFDQNVTPNLLYSDRSSNSLSNRTLLANALESAVNEGEKNLLQTYKDNLDMLNQEQENLNKVMTEIDEIRYKKSLSISGEEMSVKTFEGRAKAKAKKLGINAEDVQFKLDRSNAKYIAYAVGHGKILEADKTFRSAEESAKLKNLWGEAKEISDKISTFDRELLKLQAMQPIKEVLKREKALAWKRATEVAEQRRKESVAKVKERAAKTQRELMDRYQESRKKGRERRDKTDMRNNIRKVVKDLDKLLNRGTKDKHVKEEAREMVSASLKLAELIFSDNITNSDIVRLGVENALDKERVWLDDYAQTLDTLDELINKRELVAGTEKVSEQLLAKIGSVEEEIAKARNHISYLNGKLSDVFERERARLNKTTVDQLATDLASEYLKLKDSESDYIRAAYDEYIYKRLDALKETIGGTPVRDMSMSQLSEVYDAYKMVEHFVRNANKAFKAGKSETISTIANGVISELEAQRKPPRVIKGLDKISEFDWNNLKPVYAFERIGSANFTKIFNEVRAGEDAWATDMVEAQAFLEAQKTKHGYDTFDFDKKYDFVSSTGREFSLSLDQIMSLYAYSKRGPQAKEHLKFGGFQFDGVTEVKEKKGKVVNITYQLKDTTTYKISDELLDEIIGVLNEVKGAKAFVDEMQDYLSSTMGAKGNEVSLALYGVELFKEENYFPLRVSKDFLERAREQAMGEVKIKNSGFSQATIPKAKNTIVLSSFMDVWAGHVNEMSMYHSFVLPLEDFYRVFNYGTPNVENTDTISVVSSLRGAHRDGAVNYIDQLLKDLNGGARVDSTVGFINKMIGLFKKSAVFASASVVIQQPSAIGRATALVDAKYFVGEKVTKGKHKQVWAEVKKYAPVAVIKEMGYFDTGMGKSSVEWLKGDKTFMDKLDDLASKAPALADEITWCAIWNAVKRETLHTHKDLKPNSEEFLKAVGERFTEVITMTQVYDSTLSRSGNMRSKDTGMKMATAFMAEPTTSLNMLENALIQGKKGNKRYARKAVGAVVASMILNSILVSFVYAGRDDDEDKTYAEKYIGTLTEELLDSLNPLTLIPFVKDIVSIVQGYDVERSDMAVITDIIKAWSDLENDNRSVYRKVEDFAGSIASMFGLPVKNIMRDVRAMYNTINSFINGEKTTGSGIKNAITEGLTGESKTNGQQLYDAMLSGDAEQIERVKGRFKDQSAIDTAIRKALRDNDSRIKEAAEALNDGDFDAYSDILNEIVKEGHFDLKNVKAAILSEYEAMQPEEESEGSESKEEKEESTYETEWIYMAISQGDTASANKMREEIINTHMANGKSRKEAETSINNSITSHIKKDYEKNNISTLEAKNMLVDFLGKTEEEAASKVQYWDFKKQYPQYDDLSESAVSKYYNGYYKDGKLYGKSAASYGISVAVYYDYCKQSSECEGVDKNGDGQADTGTKKAQIMNVIDSLPLTDVQKDALYYLNGWSKSTIREAPWH